MKDAWRLVHLSARWMGGRWAWALAALPAAWPGLLALFLALGWASEGYRPENAQGSLISLPLSVLGAGLGVRLIASDIDRRTLEIAYTVPGGSHRIWNARLAAALLILAAACLFTGLVVFVFLTEFPWFVLPGAFQPAVFYLALAAALSALFRSEVTGALAVVPVLFFGFILKGTRISPFFDPFGAGLMARLDAAQLLAQQVQNRVGVLLAVAALLAMAYARAEQRERMIGG